MKIYTAATFSQQHRIRQHKEKLLTMGFSVLSTWLEEQIKPTGMSDEQFGRKMAAKDLQEIAAADCFILDMDERSATLGKIFEAGFAVAKFKLFYIVAPKGVAVNSIFLLLADHTFGSWDDLFAYFEEHHK